ncbi:hypothetical protein ROZALSC1DRAFT_27706 [Rozella allomycis CSF55]|uniref:Uncharacterized protein n=1 Tax=Rozella allomycis (strain CSF55) TaxID=988480 RepID=A0A4P9YMY3_ROZAC|nr:hypothetical protein ROZALSC1DRAFT_27706 [Rozella allomycis CSF55]
MRFLVENAVIHTKTGVQTFPWIFACLKVSYFNVNLRENSQKQDALQAVKNYKQKPLTSALDLEDSLKLLSKAQEADKDPPKCEKKKVSKPKKVKSERRRKQKEEQREAPPPKSVVDALVQGSNVSEREKEIIAQVLEGNYEKPDDMASQLDILLEEKIEYDDLNRKTETFLIFEIDFERECWRKRQKRKVSCS